MTATERKASNYGLPIVCNVVVFGLLGYAAALNTWYPDFAYFSVQEDEYLEWATFWGFILAMVTFAAAAMQRHRNKAAFPWFLWGLALFCFLVAMEEISWGQRVFGYRPPVYFLEQNYQQELNLHNVIDTDYRKLVLMLVIVGYGIVLPVLGAVKTTRRLLERFGIVAPPIWLLLSFAAIAWVYTSYPWRFSGEWVEAMLAFGFLFAAMDAQRPPKLLPQSLALTLVVAGLGASTAMLSQQQRETNPDVLKLAQLEVEALKQDFLSGEVRTRCNLHKRLFTFQEDYEQGYLQEGAFASLQTQGLPPERAEFLIDPWNSAYWLRDRCKPESRRKRVVFVYSFGPNRKRDSNQFEILGDDVGAYIKDTR